MKMIFTAMAHGLHVSYPRFFVAARPRSGHADVKGVSQSFNRSLHHLFYTSFPSRMKRSGTMLLLTLRQFQSTKPMDYLYHLGLLRVYLELESSTKAREQR